MRHITTNSSHFLPITLKTTTTIKQEYIKLIKLKHINVDKKKITNKCWFLQNITMHLAQHK